MTYETVIVLHSQRGTGPVSISGSRKVRNLKVETPFGKREEQRVLERHKGGVQ